MIPIIEQGCTQKGRDHLCKYKRKWKKSLENGNKISSHHLPNSVYAYKALSTLTVHHFFLKEQHSSKIGFLCLFGIKRNPGHVFKCFTSKVTLSLGPTQLMPRHSQLKTVGGLRLLAGFWRWQSDETWSPMTLSILDEGLHPTVLAKRSLL